MAVVVTIYATNLTACDAPVENTENWTVAPAPMSTVARSDMKCCVRPEVERAIRLWTRRASSRPKVSSR
jgi:hypothetical protein